MNKKLLALYCVYCFIGAEALFQGCKFIHENKLADGIAIMLMAASAIWVSAANAFTPELVPIRSVHE